MLIYFAYILSIQFVLAHNKQTVVQFIIKSKIKSQLFQSTAV